MTELSDRLPPLLGLVYLEAAARHGSFTRAARALHVTQSAVSHQIRALEERVGCALFVRTPQGVRATPEGARLVQAVREGLGQIAACVEQLGTAAPPEAPRALVLGAPPSLSDRWLVARLARFAQHHPGWSLRPVAGIQYHDLDRGEVDAALRYGLGQYPDHASAMLARERLIVVCAPALWPAGTPLGRVGALPVLEAYTEGSPRAEPPSAAWERHTGVGLSPTRLQFNRQSMAVAAALEGQGVAVVAAQLARDALGRGALVQPTAQSAPDALSYFLVWRRRASPAPAWVELLRAWLVSELTGAGGMSSAHTPL